MVQYFYTLPSLLLWFQVALLMSLFSCCRSVDVWSLGLIPSCSFIMLSISAGTGSVWISLTHLDYIVLANNQHGYMCARFWIIYNVLYRFIFSSPVVVLRLSLLKCL